MDAIRKQASKLREQVAKQQQAVLRQFASHIGNDGVFADELELQRHEQLERLYTSTRAAKHFQRDIVRGVEGIIAMSLKQMEIAMKLADDCTRYSHENQNPGSATLAGAALQFGTSHSTIEKERENLLRTLGVQVSDPLRAMVMSAPLQDARHLTQRYDRIWQDVDAQTAEVLRRQMKLRDSGTNTDSTVKVQHAESRLEELRSTLSALGKEAIAAMMSVEAQQQRVTFQRLLTMV
ncbi:SH3 domain-containing protein 2 [Nymphaea thermarum]|nr:SH3 domain-containing protein 2 [Nymphaea thermarum]